MGSRGLSHEAPSAMRARAPRMAMPTTAPRCRTSRPTIAFVIGPRMASVLSLDDSRRLSGLAQPVRHTQGEEESVLHSGELLRGERTDTSRESPTWDRRQRVEICDTGTGQAIRDV